MSHFQAMAVPDVPEIRPGDDLAAHLCSSFTFMTGDVLVLAQKVVSKAEGRLLDLASVNPSPEALSIGEESGKDPRLVDLILRESAHVLRLRPGTIIVQDIRGWVCANAGIDRSNVRQESGSETVCVLPLDPDASAASIRSEIKTRSGADVGIVISDSHGRAWREGTVGVAIGAAGIDALSDRRGTLDRNGYVLRHTLVGVADELATAASLLMGQGSEGVPAVVLRGLSVTGSGTARDLQRPQERDLFR